MTDPTVVRDTLLSPDNILREVVSSMAGGQALLINGSAGLGKTYSIIKMINGGGWQRAASYVVFALPSHQLIDEVNGKIEPRWTVKRYPQQPEKRCGDRAEEVKQLTAHGLGAVCKARVCAGCPHRNDCDFPDRMTPKWAIDADVILIPEQLLRAVPDIVLRWSEARDENVGPLLIIDECLSTSGEGFHHEFTMKEVNIERDVARSADELDFAAYLADILAGAAPAPPSLDPQTVVRIQERGWDSLGTDYPNRIRIMLAYGANPSWSEGGRFSVARYPYLPPATILLGAFLRAEFLQHRFGLQKPPRDLLAGVVVRHPDTRIYALRSRHCYMSVYSRHYRTVDLLIVDVVLRNIAVGRSTVIVGRKDNDRGSRATEAMKRISDLIATRKPGVEIRLCRVAEHVPKLVTPTVIPYLTYGVVGLNAFTDYQCVICTHGFAVTPEALANTIYDDFPPSRRVGVRVSSKAGYRTVTLEGNQEPWRQVYADQVIIRLELDVTLQAVARVRFAVEPREVILLTMHDPRPFVGPVIEERTADNLRAQLGLDPARNERQQAAWAVIKASLTLGSTLLAAAKAAAVSLATAKRLRASYGAGIVLPRGRPPARPSAPSG